MIDATLRNESLEAALPSNFTASDPARWRALSDKVLAGGRITAEEALSVLECPDEELLDLMSAAYEVRRKYHGKRVQLYFLMNAKSGLCPEDCKYCSQSKISDAEIPRYNLLSADKILAGAEAAYKLKSKTYCIVISARGPNEREIRALETIVPQVKEKYGLKVCACLGLMTPEQAKRLKACGVDRVNHNLNTSEEHYPEICTTHTYADRVRTLEAVRDAGIELCSGGIIGMGEKPRDVVSMAMSLRDLGVVSIPINFLNAIDGTPLAGKWVLNPRYCLKVLAMTRLVNPDREIRLGGGREIHLGSLQALALHAANSLFVGDYLTTKGQVPEADYKMISEMGFEVERPAMDSHPQEEGCCGGSCGAEGDSAQEPNAESATGSSCCSTTSAPAGQPVRGGGCGCG